MKMNFKLFKNLSTVIGIVLISFIFVSPLVYALNNSGITTDNDEIETLEVQMVELQEIDPSTVIEDNSNTVIYGEMVVNKAPLVQSLTNSPANPSLLYSGSDYDSFFDNTVFVGDSLSVGFRNYCKSSNDSMATDTTYFLAKESCSAKIVLSQNALTRYAKVMPVYNGSVTFVEDAIPKMGNIEKVFICFGMNDLVDSSPEKFVADMSELVSRIKLQSPDVSIYVISIPCVMSDVNRANLNNSNIRRANNLMASTCSQNEWGFVNLAEYLMTSDLSINPAFSSDKYVHENSSAYRIWVQVLRNYAYMS